MSDYENIIEERGEYRALTVLDTDPHEPDHEHGCPVLRIDPGRWGGANITFTGYGSASHKGDGISHSAEDALQRFVSEYGLSQGVDTFERYIRIFHGGTVAVHSLGNSREYGYLAYTTERMVREVWGNTDGTGIEAEITEWAAYVEGEVYGIRIERKVQWARLNDRGQVEGERMEVWEEVESCWGYYGEQWAEQAAREELDAFIRTVAA